VSGKKASKKLRPTSRRFESVRLEFDLRHESIGGTRIPVVRQIEALLREREVEEHESLVVIAAGLLHALSTLGYRRVDHWEVEPGGWLPLPEDTHPGLVEPVGHLIRALASERWGALSRARRFSVRLSTPDGARADAILRRVHREQDHTLTLELWGKVTEQEVRRTVGAVRERLSVVRATVSHLGGPA
jgi:hypothetical protein